MSIKYLRIISLVLFICLISTGCNSNKKNTQSNSYVLTMDITGVNGNIVIEKEFKITITNNTIASNEDTIVQAFSNNSKIASLNNSSCIIYAGQRSCNISGHANNFGETTLTASIVKLKASASANITVVDHNTMSVFLNENKDNIVVLGQKFPVTIAANDPDFITHTITVEATSNNHDILTVDDNSSCEINKTNSQCVVWVTSVQLGSTDIVVKATNKELLDNKSKLIKVSDQYTYKTSLDPNVTPETANKIIDYEYIGQDTTAETPVAVGNGLDGRYGIYSSGTNGYNNCLNQELTLNYSSSSGFIYYFDELPIDALFVFNQNSLIANFSASQPAKYLRQSITKDNTIHRHYGQIFTMYASVDNLLSKKLSSYAQDLLNQDINQFLQYCGSGVLQSATIGAAIVFDVEVVFENIRTKDDFISAYNFFDKISLWELIKNIDDFKNNTGKNAKLILSVHQFGGKHQELDNLLKKYSSLDNSIICLAGHTSTCLSLINEVIAYSQNDFPNNVHDVKTLQLFSTTKDFEYDIFAQPRQHIEVPELTKEYINSASYIQKSITTDRNLYNFLRRYQQQGFIFLLDTNMKAEITELIKSYKNMISDYSENSNIINDCVKDITNLNSSCMTAANKVKAIRAVYAKDIAAAELLGHIIYVEYTSGNQDSEILVPMDTNSTCDNDGTVCHGKFALYHSHRGTFSNNATCFVDTTFDKHYFKEINHQDWIDTHKAVYCQLNAGNVHHTYITTNGKIGHSMRTTPNTELEDNIKATLTFSKFIDTSMVI